VKNTFPEPRDSVGLKYLEQMPPKRKPDADAKPATADSGAPVKQQKQNNTNDAGFDFVPVRVVTQKSGITLSETKRDVQLKVGCNVLFHFILFHCISFHFIVFHFISLILLID
jgi:hypothetical protein